VLEQELTCLSGDKASDVLRKGDAMSEQVPEGVLSKEEQFKELLDMLTGHEKFRRHRGELGRSVADKLALIATSNQSWAQKKKQAEKLFGDLMVLLIIISNLHADKKREALSEFIRALSNPNYLLPGETIPVDQTLPATFVMFYPERVLEFLKKLVQYPVETVSEADEWLCNDPQSDFRTQWLALFSSIRNLLPNMKSSYRHMFRSFAILCKAYKKDCWEQWLDSYKARAMPIRYRYRNFQLDSVASPFPLPRYDLYFAILDARSQKSILKRFNRELQRIMATWSFNMPKRFIYDGRHAGRFVGLKIGLHPEEEHERWKKRYPAYVSRGVSHGFGAILLVQNISDYQMYLDQPDKPFRLIFE